MKNLLSKLRKFNEEINHININLFTDICLNSNKYRNIGEDLDAALQDGEEVPVKTAEVESKTVFTTDYGSIYICEKATFDEILNECAISYKIENINDFMDDFFNSHEYFKATKSDKSLMKLVLSSNNINDWEEVVLDNKSYIIFE